MSGVHQLAAYLTEDNHNEVLRRARGRSMREIEQLIAEIAPKPDVPSSIRALPQHAPSCSWEATARRGWPRRQAAPRTQWPRRRQVPPRTQWPRRRQVAPKRELTQRRDRGRKQDMARCLGRVLNQGRGSQRPERRRCPHVAPSWEHRPEDMRSAHREALPSREQIQGLDQGPRTERRRRRISRRPRQARQLRNRVQWRQRRRRPPKVSGRTVAMKSLRRRLLARATGSRTGARRWRSCQSRRI